MCLSYQGGRWFPHLSITLCGRHAHSISKFVSNSDTEVTTSSEFEMKGIRVAKKNLGMDIKRDQVQKKLFLCQKEYIQKVLNCFQVEIVKPICTLLTTFIHLSKIYTTQSHQSQSEKEYMSYVPYASIVGSLMCTLYAPD